MIPFPNKKYQLIYADPAWTYRDKANAGQRGAGHKYDCMTVQELFELQVKNIAADDCLLVMWWTGPLYDDAIMLAEYWGFKIKTMKGFTWAKVTVNGKRHFGMGNWTRANSEDCLFAVRGKPKRMDAGISQLIVARVREHSRKPNEARQALVDLMGDVPRIELFARERFPGWDAWGKEAPNE